MIKNIGIITDLDNTLYNWVEYYARCFRAMVYVLSKVTKLQEGEIIGSFQRVYKNHKSIEFPFSIQELDIWKECNWSSDRVINEALQPARYAFSRVRTKYLRLYPNVAKTLRWLKVNRVLLIAYTNAPVYQASLRLRYLGIARYFDLLVSFLDHGIPDIVPQDVIERQNQSYSQSIKNTKVYESTEMKPDTKPLMQILDEFRLDPENTYMVGDSIIRDIRMAQEAGIHDIWARYGTNNFKKDTETIKLISIHSEEDTNISKYLHETLKPTYTIDDFSELINIIRLVPPYQLPLQGF